MHKIAMKRMIENFEYFNYGLNRLNNSRVEVSNMQTDAQGITCDVTFHIDGRIEKYLDCFYPKAKMLKGLREPCQLCDKPVDGEYHSGKQCINVRED